MADRTELGMPEEMIATAVAELVSNAIAFSAPGTPIEVRGTRTSDRYRIEIADRGIGMTAEQCSEIGPFVQFDRRKRAQQGLGWDPRSSARPSDWLAAG